MELKHTAKSLQNSFDNRDDKTFKEEMEIVNDELSRAVGFPIMIYRVFSEEIVRELVKNGFSVESSNIQMQGPITEITVKI